MITPRETLNPALPRVLYLGDHHNGSARYLLAALQWAGLPCTHYDHAEEPPRALVEGRREWDVVVLSDYTAARLGAQADRSLAALVTNEGVGLIMLGGWDSFAGLHAGYRETAVGQILPVRLATTDDRRNIPTGLVLWPAAAHPLVDGLNFRLPPSVVGRNAITPRTSAQVLMNGVEVRVRGRGRTPIIEAGAARPMLIVGEAGRGRTLAFATDLAPHWCGGLVDWGRRRITVGAVEVGEVYLDFIRRMMVWTAQGAR